MSKYEILVKKTPTFFAWEEDSMTSVDSILIFCVDVHMGLDPLPPSTCVHLSLTPLRVDVINGWPLITLVRDLCQEIIQVP